MTEDPESKRKRTIERMESARNNYIGAQRDINKAREHLDDMDRNVSRAIYDIDRALPVYRQITGGAGIGHNSTYASLVNSGCNIAEKMYDHSIGLKQLTGRMPGNMTGAVFSTFASTSASGNMCGIAYETGVTVLKVFQDNRPLQEAVEQAQKPNPIEERKIFAEKLKTIEPRLAIKFEGLWQVLSDTTKKDRYRQAASSMREVLSNFQQILAPDEEVKKAEWFQPEQENGLPTQKQRVKYAIIGPEEPDFASEEDMQLIDALMNNARQRYKDLNRIVHARNEEAEEDFPLLESYIDSCQTNMTKILELREKFFKNKPA